MLFLCLPLYMSRRSDMFMRPRAVAVFPLPAFYSPFSSVPSSLWLVKDAAFSVLNQIDRAKM
jgi:hypothetical protein